MARPTTEDYRSIDIRDWERKGVLAEGTRDWCWVNDGRSIRVVTQPSRVILRYRVLGPGGEWDPIEGPISLDRTIAGLGRERSWFLCLGCDKRVAILYLRKYFRCRLCLGLVYPSQKVTPS
jgi:hypothetical protein